MQVVFVLFLLVAAAGATAHEIDATSTAPIPQETAHNQHPKIPETHRAPSTSAGDAGLPDAPSSSTKPQEIEESKVRSIGELRGVTYSRAVVQATSPSSGDAAQFVKAAPANRSGAAPLVFAGSSNDTGDHEQVDGNNRNARRNCQPASSDKSDGSNWLASLFNAATESRNYCARGEGGIWKRGTYAWSRAFEAHRNDGAIAYKDSQHFVSGVATVVPIGNYSMQDYVLQYDAGQRMATRYATAVGRDALKNMFREFWPDVSNRVLHRRP